MNLGELFAQEFCKHFMNAKCNVQEMRDGFKITITGENIFENATIKIQTSNVVWIEQIQVSPKREKHGTRFLAAVEAAAKSNRIHKLSCRAVSSPDGVLNGKEFFSALRFKEKDGGWYEKSI